MFLAGEPLSDDDQYFSGDEPTIYSYPEAKQRLAISRGARGSILVPSPDMRIRHPWNYWQNIFAFEDVTLAYSVAANLSVLVSPERAELLFQNAPHTLTEIYEPFFPV